MNLNSNDEQIQNVNEPVRPRLPSIQQLTNGHIFHQGGNPSHPTDIIIPAVKSPIGGAQLSAIHMPEVQDLQQQQRLQNVNEQLQATPSVKQRLVKRYFCKICAQGFTRKHNMVSHELIHSSLKPHICQVCNLRFRRIHDLKRHEKLHTGEKPYSCSKCLRSFARPDALTRHQNSQNACTGSASVTANSRLDPQTLQTSSSNQSEIITNGNTSPGGINEKSVDSNIANGSSVHINSSSGHREINNQPSHSNSLPVENNEPISPHQLQHPQQHPRIRQLSLPQLQSKSQFPFTNTYYHPPHVPPQAQSYSQINRQPMQTPPSAVPQGGNTSIQNQPNTQPLSLQNQRPPVVYPTNTSFSPSQFSSSTHNLPYYYPYPAYNHYPPPPPPAPSQLLPPFQFQQQQQLGPQSLPVVPLPPHTAPPSLSLTASTQLQTYHQHQNPNDPSKRPLRNSTGDISSVSNLPQTAVIHELKSVASESNPTTTKQQYPPSQNQPYSFGGGGGDPAYPPPLLITNPPHQTAIITTSGLSSMLHPPLNQQIFSLHPSNENVNPPHNTLLHSGSTNRQMDTMPLQGSGGRPVQIAPSLVPPGPRSAPSTAISIPLHNGPQYIPYENYQELYNYTQSLQQSINYLSGNLQKLEDRKSGSDEKPL